METLSQNSIEIYEEKEDLVNEEEIPDRNKVTAKDMNQIRNAILQGAFTSTCTDEELQEAIENSD